MKLFIQRLIPVIVMFGMLILSFVSLAQTSINIQATDQPNYGSEIESEDTCWFTLDFLVQSSGSPLKNVKIVVIHPNGEKEEKFNARKVGEITDNHTMVFPKSIDYDHRLLVTGMGTKKIVIKAKTIDGTSEKAIRSIFCASVEIKKLTCNAKGKIAIDAVLKTREERRFIETRLEIYRIQDGNPVFIASEPGPIPNSNNRQAIHDRVSVNNRRLHRIDLYVGITGSAGHPFSDTEFVDCPKAKDDSTTTRMGQSVKFDVVANDAPENLLSICDYSEPTSGGTIVQLSEREFSYTSSTHSITTDSFTYHACDAGGSKSNKANVDITITPNQLPDAQDDIASTPLDKTIKINVLANDSDPDYPEMDNLNVIIETQPQFGVANVNEDKTIFYRPRREGTDTFTYRIDDGNGGQDTATVTIEVGTPLCNNPNANQSLKNGKSRLTSDHTGRVVNDSSEYAYCVGLAVYKKFDATLENQQLYESNVAVIQPKATLDLNVDLPNCASQIDLFYGILLQDFKNGKRYNERLIEARQLGGDNYCLP